MPFLRAFLQSSDGKWNFPLLSKVTTIGRENCDIIIDNRNLDPQHAKIEYFENERCYLMQDLNSVNGTYVNNRRLRNASLSLDNEDEIRFGWKEDPFIFLVKEESPIPSIASSPRRMKSNQSQQLQLITETIPNGGVQFETDIPTESSIWINIPASNLTFSQNVFSKPVPILRSRTNNSLAPDCSPRPISGFNNNKKSVTYLEQFNSRKRTVENHSEFSDKLEKLEKEIKNKNNEIKSFIEKMSILQTQQRASQAQFGALKNEIDQSRRDKTVLTKLISSLEIDLTTKNSIISRQNKHIEELERRISQFETVKIEVHPASHDNILEHEVVEHRTRILSLDNTVEVLKNESLKKDEVIKSLEDELSVKKGELNRANDQMTELSNEFGMLNSKFDDANKTIESVQYQLAEKESELLENVKDSNGEKHDEELKLQREQIKLHESTIKELQENLEQSQQQEAVCAAENENLKQKLNEFERKQLEESSEQATSNENSAVDEDNAETVQVEEGIADDETSKTINEDEIINDAALGLFD